MSRSQSYCFLGIITTTFFFFCLLPLPNSFASPSRSSCRRDQRDALLELEKEFNLPTTFWNKSVDCCSWDSVTCDGILGEVISFKLSSLDITSLKPSSGLFKLQHLTHLDLSYCNLQGEIPSSISNLSHLTYLDLSFNQLGVFPVSIVNLHKLEYLDLRANRLVGELPATIGNLNQLKHMDLGRNELRGNIPKSFANFTKLSELYLIRNQFTGGDIVLANLTSLSTIDLSSNRFKSLISCDLSQLHNLEKFLVNNNSFSGPFPSFLLMIPSLLELDLSENQFVGPIDLGNNTSSSSPELHRLNLGGNNFDRLIPTSISKLVNLHVLDLSHNSFQGQVPRSISSLPYLTILDLSYNNLEGQVPHCVWRSSKIGSVLLSHNSFRTFPKSVEVVDVASLTMLDLSSNSFQELIPQWLCNFTSLSLLDFSNNHFTGSIPKCLKHHTGLNTLNLRNNSLNGYLPDLCIDGSSIQSLDVSHNILVGKLLRSLISCIYMRFLNVERNKIKDTFPFWLGSLQTLQILVLQGNEFYGPVYNSSTYLGFPNMRIIDISNNKFIGSLPHDYFLGWPEMSINWSNPEGSPESDYIGDPLTGYEDSIDLFYKGVDMDLTRSFKASEPLIILEIKFSDISLCPLVY